MLQSSQTINRLICVCVYVHVFGALKGMGRGGEGGGKLRSEGHRRACCMPRGQMS